MKTQMRTGVKTFGDEDIDTEAYDHEFTEWDYMNPRG